MIEWGWAWLAGYLLIGLLTARGLYMYMVWENDRRPAHQQTRTEPIDVAPLLFLTALLWWIVWAFAAVGGLVFAVTWMATSGVRRS